MQHEGEIRKWWDEHHTNQNHLYVSDNYGNILWRSLMLGDEIKPSKLLYIGVGAGVCVQKLHESGVTVSVVDISPVALERVHQFVDHAWLPTELMEMPCDYFDLAVSHLVTQHMSDYDLVYQIACVLQALKPDGVFAMQFAASTDSWYCIPPDSLWKFQMHGSVCRTLGAMDALVSEAKGRIVQAQETLHFPQYKSKWYSIHIKRSDIV